MPRQYVSRQYLMDAAREVREMAQYYSTRARGELTVDRLLYGYLRGGGHVVERQSPIRSRNANRRIDFLVGGPNSGAYIELVVRSSHNGNEWRLSPNRDELNKLCRAAGRQRALLIIDNSRDEPITRVRLKAEFARWRSTPGRYRRRNICVVYSAGPRHTCALGLRVTASSVSIER